MARITARRNFKFAGLLDRAIDTAAMREAGETLAVRIENRTLAGRDEHNRRFAPYSPDYQKRVKRGRSTVDLHGEPTAHMFADFGVIRVTARTVGIGFRTNESAQKAIWHEIGAGRLPIRRFLGIPVAWVREIRAQLARRLRL